MKQKIEKVAVLGAGVMGAQLAAHLSNAGVPSYLFDISQELAEKGIQSALNLKPAPFYNPRTVSLITPCNYDDHLEKLKEVDWVLEAVIERLDIKQSLFKRIEPFLKPTVIVSSNTSGISIQKMMKDMSKDFQRRFLVTHFFNPPRYMYLLEIVGGEKTQTEVVKITADFCENVLGKGIVYAKDTPNFIANRIGTFGIMLTLKLTREMNLTVEEVDKITGTLVGRPKSASFRTADVVGLDTLAHVARNTYEFCTEDEAREIFQVPDFLQKMLDKGLLGQKSKKGFYQKVNQEILSIDFETLDYKPQKEVRLDGYRVAKAYTKTTERIKALAYSDDTAGKFFWELLAGTLIYTANRIPEIADDIFNIDKAMKWGFGWELGPFETWDAIGVEKSLKRMDDEGKKVPAWVKDLVNSGKATFYSRTPEHITYYDFIQNDYQILPEKPKQFFLKIEKVKSKEIKKNWCASIIDLGDGVVCLEF
ncbi:MAG: 3-hydroxyacyl-CoA dehydrogenase NAD-binding domain-containing protein, partial [Candidatus Zixiibacteriota bacterium]